MASNLSPRSQSKRQTQVSAYDLNGDGVLDADEYKLLRYDKDGNGQLDEDELALAGKEDTMFSFRASGDRRSGKETFLGAGLKVDMMFLNGSDDVPEQFICPITDRPMTEPVTASGAKAMAGPLFGSDTALIISWVADGFTYERQAIKGVFDTQRTQCFSPCTGKCPAQKGRDSINVGL